MEEVTIEMKGAPGVAKQPPTLAQEGIGQFISQGEREWLRGPLSKAASYRLIVNGDLGPKELGKLITLLQAQKDVLSDDGEETQH